ncbi:hypothetical protein CC86DRAFT_349517 [Ophiobolus disseminans]|uniref:F-box domain-containing protein n=1 Tax=Ophiobolus disseminans TaxID=1469910 RepID=A0A6A6ZZU9_9PLEO|nr:hypothetical protein CC86DRAFT_349517 [Ophiobolus disseminans]
MEPAILTTAQHHLPTELVLVVLDHLADDKKTLCRLARTSRALQRLAEEHIYKTIELNTVLDLHSITDAFDGRNERVRAVQTLKLQYEYSVDDLDDSADERKTFNGFVADMVSLRELYIESPYDNSGNWEDGPGPREWVEGDMERFRAALELACTEGRVEAQRMQKERKLVNSLERTVGLSLLDSLTIHSHGVDTEFWDLDGFHCLFRHPSLRHLHVSCISLTEEIPALQSHTGTTPLTTLIFNECEIAPVSLRDMLRMPSNLRHLTLGENVWNTQRSKRLHPRLTQNARATLEALTAVADSLESLTHLDPSWKLDVECDRASRMKPIGDGMRSFHALRFIECEVTSFLHQAFIMNHELAPPNLETLRLRRHWYVAVDFFDHPPEVETYLALPSLSTLELMQSSNCWHELSTADYVCDEERLRSRHAYAYKLHKAGINLKVLVELHRDGRTIPPFLHNEALPIIDCWYDAQDVGFRRIIKDDLSDEELPETDQLGEVDVKYIKVQTRRTIQLLKNCFIKDRYFPSEESILQFIDDEAEYEQEASDMDDGEFDMEVDDDWDGELDMAVDDDGNTVYFHEHNGEVYVALYESSTENEEMDQGALDEELD